MFHCNNLIYSGARMTCPANATIVYSEQHCQAERILITLDNPISGGNPVILAGDVTGSIGSNVVTKIQGSPVSVTAPTTGQVLAWNGTVYTPTTLVSGGSTTTTNVLSIIGNNITSTVNNVASTIALPSTSATSNTLSLNGSNLTSTVNGVVSNVIALPASTLSTLSVVLPTTLIASGDTFQIVSEKLQGQILAKQNILTIQDESTLLVTNPNTINFVGSGVTATNSAGVVTVNISSSASFVSPLTSKGDIYIRNATNDTKLAVGTDGFALVADSTNPTGLVYKNITPTADYLSSTNVIVPANGSVAIPHNLALSVPYGMFYSIYDVISGEFTPEKLVPNTVNSATFYSVTGGTYRFIIKKAI